MTLSPTLKLLLETPGLLSKDSFVNILISNRYKLFNVDDCSSIHLTLAKPICVSGIVPGVDIAVSRSLIGL